ncbi:putative signal peptide protein [Puccinia sorghi]|uniref:Putative signal peptide protein n=1 Tax=Puccinia sorghi TaxID=27349 RepID=A0A0L6UFW5_9BASI|nr:putative signal peptide protein [Puccinia sorghi]
MKMMMVMMYEVWRRLLFGLLGNNGDWMWVGDERIVVPWRVVVARVRSRLLVIAVPVVDGVGALISGCYWLRMICSGLLNIWLLLLLLMMVVMMRWMMMMVMMMLLSLLLLGCCWYYYFDIDEKMVVVVVVAVVGRVRGMMVMRHGKCGFYYKIDHNFLLRLGRERGDLKKVVFHVSQFMINSKKLCTYLTIYVHKPVRHRNHVRPATSPSRQKTKKKNHQKKQNKKKKNITSPAGRSSTSLLCIITKQPDRVTTNEKRHGKLPKPHPTSLLAVFLCKDRGGREITLEAHTLYHILAPLWCFVYLRGLPYLNYRFKILFNMHTSRRNDKKKPVFFFLKLRARIVGQDLRSLYLMSNCIKFILTTLRQTKRKLCICCQVQIHVILYDIMFQSLNALHSNICILEQREKKESPDSEGYDWSHRLWDLRRGKASTEYEGVRAHHQLETFNHTQYTYTPSTSFLIDHLNLRWIIVSACIQHTHTPLFFILQVYEHPTVRLSPLAWRCSNSEISMLLPSHTASPRKTTALEGPPPENEAKKPLTSSARFHVEGRGLPDPLRTATRLCDSNLPQMSKIYHFSANHLPVLQEGENNHLPTASFFLTHAVWRKLLCVKESGSNSQEVSYQKIQPFFFLAMTLRKLSLGKSKRLVYSITRQEKIFHSIIKHQQETQKSTPTKHLFFLSLSLMIDTLLWPSACGVKNQLPIRHKKENFIHIGMIILVEIRTFDTISDSHPAKPSGVWGVHLSHPNQPHLVGLPWGFHTRHGVSENGKAFQEGKKSYMVWRMRKVKIDTYGPKFYMDVEIQEMKRKYEATFEPLIDPQSLPTHRQINIILMNFSFCFLKLKGFVSLGNHHLDYRIETNNNKQKEKEKEKISNKYKTGKLHTLENIILKSEFPLRKSVFELGRERIFHRGDILHNHSILIPNSYLHNYSRELWIPSLYWLAKHPPPSLSSSFLHHYICSYWYREFWIPSLYWIDNSIKPLNWTRTESLQDIVTILPLVNFFLEQSHWLENQQYYSRFVWISRLPHDSSPFWILSHLTPACIFKWNHPKDARTKVYRPMDFLPCQGGHLIIMLQRVNAIFLLQQAHSHSSPVTAAKLEIFSEILLSRGNIKTLPQKFRKNDGNIYFEFWNVLIIFIRVFGVFGTGVFKCPGDYKG